MARDAIEQRSATRRVDDCWNRIGTRGDRSCPRLAEHSLCPNCPVFEQGAAMLLDRPLSDADIAESALQAAGASRAEAAGTTAQGPGAVVLNAANATSAGRPAVHSVLAFRIADEWLALPTAVLRQIADTRPIHSLPHRRNRAILGVVNIRGTLRMAVSLGELLQLDRTGLGKQASRNKYARMLVAAHRGEPVVFPVDEVEGVLRFAASARMPVPATLAQASDSHSRGVFAWRDTTIGLLDADRVFDSLPRSLR
jgi:chemotaxis-related protein WspD